MCQKWHLHRYFFFTVWCQKAFYFPHEEFTQLQSGPDYTLSIFLTGENSLATFDFYLSSLCGFMIYRQSEACCVNLENFRMG